MIHRYNVLGVNIVIDIASGAVHVLDDVAYKLLEFFNDKGEADLDKAQDLEYSKDEINEAYDEIMTLINDGLLFTKDVYEDLSHIEKGSVIKALCLHICHDCNLRCKYCFASTGSFKGERSMMSAETGKKAIDFVIENSAHRKNIEIDYFGGEPLMNFDVVKEITEYAKEQGKKFGKTFRFTLTTNGMLLNEDVKKYVNENMSNVVLSIDGRKEVNDNMRLTAGGKGCYDVILPKFLDLAQSRGDDNYYVRGTFTRHNTDFAEDVIHLADLGFGQISVEPVVANEAEDYALKEEDLPKIFEQYEYLAKQMVERKKNGKGFNFFHYMIDLEQGPCVYKRLSGCGSGHEYVAVTPDGDIYPCHQFVDKPEFKLGSVYGGDYNKEIGKQFERSNVYTKDACKKCWARFYCSGGCPANAFDMNKDINKPYNLACEMEKKRVECAIAIKALC